MSAIEIVTSIAIVIAVILSLVVINWAMDRDADRRRKDEAMKGVEEFSKAREVLLRGLK